MIRILLLFLALVVLLLVYVIIPAIFGLLLILYTAVTSKWKKGRTAKKSNIIAQTKSENEVEIVGSNALLANNNQAIESLIEEVKSADNLSDTSLDWRQDLMEYLAIQQGLSGLKNRYSALQNATYVAGVLIREFLDSSKETFFYDFIMQRCEEMRFSSPLEEFAYGLNADIITKLKEGEETKTIESFAKKKSKDYEITNRPAPEALYPLPKTGDDQMDRFARLAIELAHTRLRHLKVQKYDVKEAIAELSINPARRDYHDFPDFFSHAFQFGYLTEKRFQRLYFLLYNIAEAISLGYTDAQIRHQINNLFVVEVDARNEDGDTAATKPNQESNKRVVLEPIPYCDFDEKEHMIISVAARISREHCDDPIYRNTAKFAIDLINQYHQADTEYSERSFFSISTTLLKSQKPRFAQVYKLILYIANCIFEGKTEQQTYLLVSNNIKPRDLSYNRAASKTSSPASKKQSLDVNLKNDLMNAILACQMRRGESQCLELANSLHSCCDLAEIKSGMEYYSKLRNAMGNFRYAKGFQEIAPVMDYILYCKKNGVSNVSLKALVGTKFPSRYRKESN